jgi:hypothetical protein
MPHVMTRNDLDASLPARRKANNTALRARVRLRLGRGWRRTATASADSSSTAAAEKTTRFYLLSEKLLVGGESESTIWSERGDEPILPAEARGTEITRFNALRHGVLSRYIVLPWEDAEEYRALVSALAAEHAPHGPTEEHLVEGIAGILWRKRRLRLAEAAAHRRGLAGTLPRYRNTLEAALVHVDAASQTERVVLFYPYGKTYVQTLGEQD